MSIALRPSRVRLVSRRLVLTGAGGAAVTALVAACGGAPATPTVATNVTVPTVKATEKVATAAPPPTGSAPKAAAASTAVKITGAFDGEAKTLTGAGATFPAALYSKWFNEYLKVSQVKVNYQSIGSGGGIKSIQDQTVDFGATDGPMTDEQLAGAKGGAILHIPMALGAVVPTYNLPEWQGKSPVKFTAETLSSIYLGTIKRWNDAKLLVDNPDLKAVDKEIIVVRRSDGSGTSYIFTDYLSTVSADWKAKVGRGTSVNWPVGLGGKGNEGVAGEVKQNAYSIGYVELIYALQNKLGVGLVKNVGGAFVEPNLASVTAAAAAMADKVPADLRASLVNAPGAASYPIAGFTWVLAYQQMAEMAKAVALTRLLWWCTTEAQQWNAELGYAPLPDAIVERGQAMVASVTVNGKPAFPGR